MRSRHLLVGAGLLHSARAIPAYITTVFSCPNVVTVTQTVYPPGWTNTGPIYTTRPLTEPRPESEGGYTAPPPQAEVCTERGLTTSWETDYSTTTVYFSEYGMYAGPPGCPSTIIAYMPTTVTCSAPQTTGWVGYAEDIACASCTATTLVGLRPGYSTYNGAVTTYYTVFTEVYVEAGATTQANLVGGQWTTTGTAPYAAPYAKECTSTYNGNAATPTVGGGYTATRGGTPRPYPSIDYNDPNVFNGGKSVPIVSNGYTQGNAAPTRGYETPAGTQSVPYTWTRGGGYPSINYDDPNVFRGGPGTGTPYTAPRPAPTTGPGEQATAQTEAPAPTTRRGGYPTINYDDPNVFRGGSGTGTGTVAPRPPPSTGPGEQATARTEAPAPTTRRGGYPTINYDDPNVFRGGSGTGTGAPRPPPTTGPGEQATARTEGPTTRTGPAASGRPTSYPADFDDPNVFRPLTGGITIVSATGTPPVQTPATTTYTVRSNFGDNYASIDADASENFRPLTGGISIVSLNPPQSFPAPITTSIPVTSRATSNYPSINYADPSIFRGIDPNGGGAAPASTASTPVTRATSTASA